MSRYRERLQWIEHCLARHPGLEKLPDEQLKAVLAGFVAKRLEGSSHSLEEKQQLSQDLFKTMRGFDILQDYLDDPEVSEVMVNGPEHIFIEKGGKLRRAPLRFDDNEHLLQLIMRSFGKANRLINEQRPIAGLRFHDGSRLQAVLPPASLNGPAFSLRRFGGLKASLDELVARDSLSPAAARFLAAAVRAKKNIFVSGGTGSGKTTFLNALSRAIPAAERVITIEDTAELELRGLPNLLRLEGREPGPDGEGAVRLEELIRASLRLRPDRIIVGEVRGTEAFSMIEAMRSGHPGSMSTGHANNPEDMLERLSLLLLMHAGIPWSAIVRMLSSAIDLLIQLERLPDGKRQVHSIVKPLDPENERFRLEKLFVRDKWGRLSARPTKPPASRKEISHEAVPPFLQAAP